MTEAGGWANALWWQAFGHMADHRLWRAVASGEGRARAKSRLKPGLYKTFE